MSKQKTTRPRMTAKDAGQLIFDVWYKADDAGMSQVETRSALGLTAKQFQNGKSYLREQLCLDNAAPFTYDPRDNVYRLNTNSEQVEEYYEMRLSIALKQLVQLSNGTTAPARDKWKDNRKIARIWRHVDNLIEDMQDALEG